MAKVVFTSHLGSVAPSDPCHYEAPDVGGVLTAAFTDHPGLQHYILDDQGKVRRHVVIFVDGCQLPRAEALDAPVKTGSEVYVLQALSGG